MIEHQLSKVSVLMPCGENSRFIESAIRSVLTQDFLNYGELELIIVEDGIDLKSRLSETFLAHPLIRIVKSPGSGLVTALNFGLSQCRFDLVARLDSDDLMNLNRISIQHSFMTSNHDVAVCGSHTIVVDEFGVIQRISRDVTSAESIRKELDFRCCLAHPSVMYRKQVIIDAGGYREFFRHAEDYDLWLRLKDKHRIENIPLLLTIYRQHGNQVSQTSKKSQVISTLAALEAYRLQALSGVDLTGSYESAVDWFRRRNLYKFFEFFSFVSWSSKSGVFLRLFEIVHSRPNRLLKAIVCKVKKKSNHG